MQGALAIGKVRISEPDSSNELGDSDFILKMNIAEFALHALLLFLII